MITVGYDEGELRPRKLTVEEIENPEQVIEEFFDYARLPHVRSYLWEMFKTMISCDYPKLKRRERSNLIYFYEKIEKVIEAVHLIYERKNMG